MFSRPREILLVEDHADSAAALTKLLRLRGHRVHAVASCAEARQLFQLRATIDLLLVDLGLPDGDGCELLHQLLAIRRVPAIAVTGYAMPQEITRCAQAGFAGHITKPLDMAQLSQMIGDVSPAAAEPPPPQAAQPAVPQVH
jgi:CheY-like chemotaxis protein